ncbi:MULTISPECIES: hypothetical protein [unclassified Sphingopyxis]|uniref:hypothetical protein n=1 Tax=unclassified Sphingopyxis TaxID=2614943 RepID=UPI0012E3DDA1|nr:MULTISPECIES: hypothetical protein [unclassified Sphingopyxis]
MQQLRRLLSSKQDWRPINCGLLAPPGEDHKDPVIERCGRAADSTEGFDSDGAKREQIPNGEMALYRGKIDIEMWGRMWGSIPCHEFYRYISTI